MTWTVDAQLRKRLLTEIGRNSLLSRIVGPDNDGALGDRRRVGTYGAVFQAGRESVIRIHFHTKTERGGRSFVASVQDRDDSVTLQKMSSTSMTWNWVAGRPPSACIDFE